MAFKPETGLVIHHQRLGKSFTFSGGTFASSVNAEEIFILCASTSTGDELRDRFQARALVEIRKVATFCARIEAALPPTATFRAQRVHYYSPAGELGAKWAFPDMIAFSKIDSFAWQDEYRFCFSFTALSSTDKLNST